MTGDWQRGLIAPPPGVVGNPSNVVQAAADQGDLVSAKGPAGTALIFGDCLIHSSPPNLSPWTRGIFSLILNPISNR
jgi:ectoine hydroxylase